MGKWIKKPEARRRLYSLSFLILIYLAAKNILDRDLYALLYGALTIISGMAAVNVPTKEQQETLNNS